jgi:biopolymer transport protein ExbD
MSIEVKCIECGASHRVNQNMAGRRVRCPQCDAAVHVPEIETEPLDPAKDDEVVVVSEVTEVVPLVEQEQVVEPVPLFPVTPIHVAHAEKVSPAEPHETHIVILDGEDDDDPVLVRKKRPDEEIDMTPMVDVTFLLLIFFMVTAAFSLQKSIQMPRQQTDQPSSNIEEEIDELDVVEIEVDEYGSFLVMAPNFERETPGKQNLITALREAIAGDRDGMRLDIKVHEMAKLHALVDAMDAGTIAGYSELHVTQVEEFD